MVSHMGKERYCEKKKNYELIMKIIEHTNNMNIDMIHIKSSHWLARFKFNW